MFLICISTFLHMHLEFRIQVLRELNLLNMKLNDVETSLNNVMLRKENILDCAENVNEEFSSKKT